MSGFDSQWFVNVRLGSSLSTWNVSKANNCRKQQASFLNESAGFRFSLIAIAIAPATPDSSQAVSLIGLKDLNRLD